ncbi:MAG: Heavy metal efflux outer membrane protein CzcC family [Gemmataceae bacterium]|nr:Heavy metal efflux outer membrane protein CzcC family [Gemmataceae bacterium]
MTSTGRIRVIGCAVVCAALGGCATDRDTRTPDELRVVTGPVASARQPGPVVPPPSADVVQAASRADPDDLPAPRPVGPAQPLAAAAELTPDAVVRAVLDRNPTLDEMRAAAEAAAARYPQSTSLDDPVVSFNTAPVSAGSRDADYATRVELSQKFLYPGKRGLKGQVSIAEAAAAARDVDDTRLRLVEAAKAALADYYLAGKGTTVAEANAKLLREFRQNAETRYKTGQAPQQDMLQADVELARQEERLVGLRRARQVAVARINTLMHLPPDSPLPPPAEIRRAGPLPDPAELRALAAGVRPDVKAAADRLAAGEAALALALKEYNPDVEFMTAYDGFWQGPGGRPLQWQVGARMNLPVRYARRGGAVAEAKATVARRRAELARLTDRVNFEVQEAFEQAREMDDVVVLYETKVLPAAEANVKEAQAGYVTGRVPFLNLVEAQRNRVGLKDRYFEVVAESARRRAALERATGGPVPTAPPGR